MPARWDLAVTARFAWVTAALLGACGGARTTAANVPSGTHAPLNVIVISLDAVRYDRTGLGPAPTSFTPNLDRFARDAVVFHQAASAAPWTVPSHMAMWTGRWPTRHGLVNKLRPDPTTGATVDATLDPSIETYPDRLRAAGYTAVAFTGGAGVSGRFGFGRGFATYLDDRRFAGMDYSAPPAVAWLRARAPNAGPFFMFLHGYDVHGQRPLPGLDRTAIAPGYRGALDGSIEENARLREQGLSVIRTPGEAASLRGVIDVDDGRFLRDVYDRKLALADQRFGAFLDELRARDLLDRSIVAVVSDHGDEFMEHGHIDHGHTLYEEQLHVVMMIRYPHGEGHRAVRTPARTLDLFPTIFDALGLRGPDGVDGESLRVDPPATRPVFAESDYRLFVHHRMVRVGDYKLVVDLGDDEVTMFDLARDPGETVNLVAREPDRRAVMERLLDGWLTRQGTRRDAFLGVRESHITIF
jgi:arylsulfatase A-like enzyme